jgi:hypothetical protein
VQKLSFPGLRKCHLLNEKHLQKIINGIKLIYNVNLIAFTGFNVFNTLISKIFAVFDKEKESGWQFMVKESIQKII